MTDHLLDIARTLAHRAGAVARHGRTSGLAEVGTKSSLTDMVTEYDKACEVIVFEGLRAARPRDSIIGEEGARHVGDSGLTWFIDPIDGTTNFLYDVPMWAVSIGAADADGPLVGVVHNPTANETFTAIRGEGAFLNEQPISCNAAATLATALIATGFSYAPEARVVQAQRVAQMIHRIRDIRRFGAAAIDMCYVACGRLDGYFEENLHPWDIAAGDLIAREAGCRTGDFRGGPIRPAETLTASPTIFEPLGALIVGASPTISQD
jgi:myo-inositol-1(or 4)-monophosphatase